MGSDFWSYLERLEIMAFFAGYPLVYAIVQVISGNTKKNRISFLNKINRILPYAYALAGTLYLGLVLKNLYPDYSLKNISAYFDSSYLKIWGLLSLLFLIPLVAKKPVISLLHSLIFFFCLVLDLFQFNSSSSDRDMIRNEIKIYSDSLLLNVATFIVVVIIFYFAKKTRNKKATVDHT